MNSVILPHPRPCRRHPDSDASRETLAQTPIRFGGGQLARHPERLETWAAGGIPGPLAIEVGVTHGCNHDCIHCSTQQMTPFEMHKNFLPREAFLRFLQDFAALGGQEVFFAGNGEPLLHPHLPEFFQVGHELGLRMALSSNGQILTERMAPRILPYAAWIRVSVNGGDRETYAAVHRCQPKEWDRLVANLENAVALRKRDRLPVELALQGVVFDRNWDAIPALAQLHRKVGTDTLVFRNRIDKYDGDFPIPPAVRLLLEEAERDPSVQVRWNTFTDQALLPPWSRCIGVNVRTNMDFQGNLFSCAKHFYEDCSFGNICENSFREIWHGEARKRLFPQIEKGENIRFCWKWCQCSYDNRFAEEWLAQREKPA
ncbi:MAG: radical SAM protein [Magnetococcales bacterium]|nr:radical SAM protein [Magnetococcales bacterium]